jgi:hypothetical protein
MTGGGRSKVKKRREERENPKRKSEKIRKD